MAGEVLPVVKNTPVLAGVNGTDPFRDMDVFLDQLKRWSPVCRISDRRADRRRLPPISKETGMPYALEVEMIAKARAQEMLTTLRVQRSRRHGDGRAGADYRSAISA